MKTALTLIAVAATLLASTHLASAGPSIDAALACGTQGSAGGLAAGTGLWRIDVDNTVYPQAVCNDGTGAVFYVRRATRAAARDRWHIHLQGGGGCRDADSCARRWCSVDTNFGMDKMTSALAPSPGARGPGMLSDNPDNPLHDWNQVLIYYCSSDSWSGTQAGIELTAEAPGGGATVDFDIAFQGGNIIDAVLETLQRANGPVQYLDEQGLQTLPDLDEARRVILAGASAGGNGVFRQADRVHEKLKSTNTSCTVPGGCSLDYRAVIDAAFEPDRANLGHADTVMCLEQGLCSYEAFSAWDWQNSQVALWEAQTDESCLQWHATHMPGHEWRCGLSVFIARNHLQAPHFIRFDLLDPLISSNMQDAGYTWLGHPVNLKVFGLLAYEQLSAVGDFWQTALEAPPTRGEPATKPAVFGVQCAHHASLMNTPMYLEAQAPDADGIPRTMPELLVNWLAGTGPTEAIVPISSITPLAHCP